MTWSIVARAADGSLGVAVASRFFAVGALCPHAQAGVAALATQALVNPTYAAQALAKLAGGGAPASVVDELIGGDEGREHRQLHLIDAHGRIAAYTGSSCIDWCGHLPGDGYSVAGNMLAGRYVLDATAAAYESAAPLPFAQRLLDALRAGDDAGGDKRGKQAAALIAYGTETYPVLDLRVDDHAEPMLELQRLYDKSRERFQAFVECLPTAARPAGITDRALIEAHVTRRLAQLAAEDEERRARRA